MTDHADLIARLRRIESSSTQNMSNSVTTNWLRNPDGPAAADALEAQAHEIRKLNEYIAANMTDDELAKDSAQLSASLIETESRLAAAERERDEIMAMAERREGELQARLFEAVALLREAAPFIGWSGRPDGLVERIDAFLGRYA